MRIGAKDEATKLIERECLRIEERYAGYHADLIKRLREILLHEKQKNPLIVSYIKSQIEDFGDQLGNKQS